MKVELRANLFGLGAFEIGLRGGNVLLAVTVFFQLVIGFGLSDGGAGFGNFLGAKTTFGFFGVGARLFQGGLQFLVIKGEQNLSGLNGVAFANQDFVDAAANFRSDPNVACFDGAGAVHAAVAMKHAGV